MNPTLLLVLVGLLWVTFFGTLLIGYLEQKLKEWRVSIIILFLLAIASMLVAVFAVHTTPVIN